MITTRRAAPAACCCTALLLFACESATGPEPPIELEAATPAYLTGAVAADVSPTPIVRLRYEDGTVASGVTVSFTASGNGAVASSSAVTDSDGRASPGAWRLGTTAGIQLLTAHAGDGSVVFTADVSAGPVAALTDVYGNAQKAAAGATLRVRLHVRALDIFGNPVARAAVTFAVIDGGGAIAADTAVTDSTGLASSGPWTLGPVVGEQRVRAQSGPVQIVFSADACDPDLCPRPANVLAYVNDFSIYTLDESTGIVRRLTSTDRHNHPAWSPDGTRIAFTRYDSSWRYPDVWIMNDDGFEAMPIASGSSPSWSPGGDALVFAKGDCIYYCDIYVQSLVDGGGPRHLATSAAFPAWSPDGSRIAFVALSGDDGYHSLRLVDPDGRNNTAVTPIDEGGIIGPAWSPDGTLIAFSKCMRGTCDIHIVRPDGSGLRKLTTVGDASMRPAWSAGGRRIAFTRWSGNLPSIVWVPVDGGEAVTLVSQGHSPAWRP